LNFFAISDFFSSFYKPGNRAAAARLRHSVLSTFMQQPLSLAALDFYFNLTILDFYALQGLRGSCSAWGADASPFTF